MELDAIFINSASDTACYDILEREVNGTVLVNPTWSEVTELLENSRRDVVIFGHGTEYGVFSHDFGDYLISDFDAELLSNRRVIGIWCFANKFADKYKLHGLFSGMIISELHEAIENKIPATKEEIDAEMDKFTLRLKYCIENYPLNEVPQRMLELDDTKSELTRFNYGNLVYYT